MVIGVTKHFAKRRAIATILEWLENNRNGASCDPLCKGRRDPPLQGEEPDLWSRRGGRDRQRGQTKAKEKKMRKASRGQ